MAIKLLVFFNLNSVMIGGVTAHFLHVSKSVAHKVMAVADGTYMGEQGKVEYVHTKMVACFFHASVISD